MSHTWRAAVPITKLLALTGALLIAACGAAEMPTDPVDTAFESLKLGNVAYQQPPDSLEQGNSAHALIRISKALPNGLTNGLQKSLTTVSSVRVANQMKAELTSDDDGLQIKPWNAGDGWLDVGQQDWTEWDWTVIGVQAGRHTVHLTLFVSLGSFSEHNFKALPVLDKEVQVTVSGPLLVGSLYSQYGVPTVNAVLEGLAAFGLAALLTTLGLKRGKRSRARVKPNNG